MVLEFFISITAIPLLIHLIFVHINLGTSVTSFLVKYVYKDDVLAKKIAKIMVAGEFVSGTLGTVLTVILAGIWTPLMNIVANILYIPLLIALMGIVLRISSIGGYWYTLDRRGGANLIFGILMIVGGFMIPFGFRYIFAFINYPFGIESIDPLKGDIVMVLLNPLFPPLYLITVSTVLMVGFTVSVIIVDERFKTRFIKYGLISTLTFLIGFIWYLYLLNIYSQYIIQSIFSFSGLSIYTFVLTIASSILLILISAYMVLGRGKSYSGTPLLALSLTTMLAMEFTFDYSRFPYFVVTGETGIDALSLLNFTVTAGFGEIGSVFVILMSVVAISIAGVYLLIVKNYFVE